MRSSTVSSSADGVPSGPEFTARSEVISSVKSRIAFSDRVASPMPVSARSSAAPNEMPSCSANTSIVASARSPIPRRGVLRIRRNDTMSSALAITRR